MAVRLRQQKKAMLYLFLAVIFISLFSFIFLTYTQYRYQDKQEVMSVRIHTMNEFISDFHEDLDRASYISGFRALLGVEEFLSSKGSFFDNSTELEEAFRTAFMTGEINGTSMEILDDASFQDYLTRVQQQATTIGINLTANITRVYLTQHEPWIITVNFTGHFIIADERNAAWWDYEKTFLTEVPIYGLKDPLYTVNTYGRVPVIVLNYTLPSEGFVADDNTTTNLKEFIENAYYKTSSDAPSFLQRFTNNLSASPNGIESLVYLPALSDQGIIVNTNRSVVDYLYFAPVYTGGPDYCSIQNMIYSPDWFRIDQDHLDDYELDQLAPTVCP